MSNPWISKLSIISLLMLCYANIFPLKIYSFFFWFSCFGLKCSKKPFRIVTTLRRWNFNLRIYGKNPQFVKRQCMHFGFVCHQMCDFVGSSHASVSCGFCSHFFLRFSKIYGWGFCFSSSLIFDRLESNRIESHQICHKDARIHIKCCGFNLNCVVYAVLRCMPALFSTFDCFILMSELEPSRSIRRNTVRPFFSANTHNTTDDKKQQQ